MEIIVRFLTSSYRSRRAGILYCDNGTVELVRHGDAHDEDIALLHDIGEVLGNIIQGAEKLPSHDSLTMYTEFVEWGAENIVFHVARHERCISVFVLSAGHGINVLLLTALDNTDCSDFRPGGQHWASYLRSMVNAIAQQSRMLAISRLWSSSCNQQWFLDGARAERSEEEDDVQVVGVGRVHPDNIILPSLRYQDIPLGAELEDGVEFAGESGAPPTQRYGTQRSSRTHRP